MDAKTSPRPSCRDCEAGQQSPTPRPLWAPWRIDYIRAPKDGGCFLCELAGQAAIAADSLVIARGEAAFVLLNAFPYNSGHLLIAPYAHLADLGELPEATAAEMWQLTLRAKQAMASLLHPDGFNYGFNLGAAAGAGLEEHVHGHLVPRWFGDTNFMPVIGGVRVMPEALEATARLLREAWSTTT